VKRKPVMHIVRIAVITALLSSTMVLPVAALPAPTGPVPNAALFYGHSLKGMTYAAARSLIASEYAHLPVLTVKLGTRSWKYNLRASVKPDFDTTLLQAYASKSDSSAPFAILPSYKTDPVKIRSWVIGVAKQTDTKPISARYVVFKARALSVVVPRNGQQLRVTEGADALVRAIRSEMSGGVAQRPVLFSAKPISPAVTMKNLGKAIFVRLSQRHLYLYNGAKYERDYRIAIGQPEFPTPQGTFKIIRKVMNPSWTNPGSGWASGMPSYIGPGPSNPLGTRALYLNASGIRIHGTNNIGSIGTPASHGCMRMARADVEDIYPRVPVGTPVFILR
jgi:lipoprotein-anchoring transpeptidase ErfK/SrfK